MNFKASLDLSTEMHCILDNTGLIFENNITFCQALQYTKEELTGKNFWDFVAEEERVSLQLLFKNLKPLKPKTFESKIKTKNQEILQLKGKIQLLEEGYYAIVANMVLIQDALLARFRRFFDLALLDIVVILNLNKEIIYANKDFDEIMGLDNHREKLGDLLSLIHPDDREEIKHFLDWLIQEEGTSRQITNRCVSQSGEFKWIFWKGIYAKEYFYFIGHDITGQRNQELKIQELLTSTIDLNQTLETRNDQLETTANNLETTLKELELRNFELDQFVYKVSHDLRAPLTSILGVVNLAKIDPDNLARLHEYFNLIERSTLKLDKFIRSLLEYSRGNRAELVIEKVDFDKIIQESLNDLRYMKNYDRIEKRIHLKKAKAFYSDTLRLSILFNNIISNAIKYQHISREKSFLEIRVEEINPHYWEINFEDNGIGIKREYLYNVFNMFFRASENSEGSGLGLYIVKQTVEKLNGTISIDSEFGKYTHIKIVLPNMTPLENNR